MILEKELIVEKIERTDNLSKPYKITFLDNIEFDGKVYPTPATANSEVQLEVNKHYQLFVKPWDMNGRKGFSIVGIKHEYPLKK